MSALCPPRRTGSGGGDCPAGRHRGHPSSGSGLGEEPGGALTPWAAEAEADSVTEAAGWEGRPDPSPKPPKGQHSGAKTALGFWREEARGGWPSFRAARQTSTLSLLSLRERPCLGGRVQTQGRGGGVWGGPQRRGGPASRPKGPWRVSPGRGLGGALTPGQAVGGALPPTLGKQHPELFLPKGSAADSCHSRFMGVHCRAVTRSPT